MTTISLAEIVADARALSTVAEKAQFLKANNSKELRNILILMYDRRFTFDLPTTPPPYRPSVVNESHGLLYREARKLSYFVNEMKDGENLDRVRKEALFIQMLESVDKDDALLLLQMLAKEPYPDLPVEAIHEAFGPIIQNPIEASPEKRGRGRPKKVA
tara:strand:- start:835 stop:1311 length:477 start_codon:yes stop_codon:yes gene_type:complete